jgi:hypothetical protein
MTATTGNVQPSVPTSSHTYFKRVRMTRTKAIFHSLRIWLITAKGVPRLSIPKMRTCCSHDCALKTHTKKCQCWNLGFYPPAFFFYQFLLFAVFHAVRLVVCCRNAESGADPVHHVSYESEATRGKQNQALAAVRSLTIPMCQETSHKYSPPFQSDPFTQRSVTANWSSWHSGKSQAVK